MSKTERVLAGAAAGAVLVPVAVYCASAIVHQIRYGSLQEFWGLFLAARAVPPGALIGGIWAYLLARRG